MNRFIQFEDSLVRVAWSRCRDNQFPFAKDGKSSFDELDPNFAPREERRSASGCSFPLIHARAFEAMSAAGFWDEFERMKVQLVAHVDDARKVYPSLDVQVWDFSGYNNITSEPIPGDRTQAMQWFYDSSHFTDAFGRMILDNIYLEAPQQKIGSRITTDNIEDHLQKLRFEQQEYRNRNQQQFFQINSKVRGYPGR